MANFLKNLFGSKKDIEVDKEKNIEPLPKLVKDLKDGSRFDIKLGAKTIKFLTIADCHGSLREKELQETVSESPDIVLLLGDNFYNDLELILDFAANKFPNASILGVTGNHDDKSILKDNFAEKIIDLDRTIFQHDTIKIGGLSGSIRYKPDSKFAMLTNEESEQIMSDFPKCDLLVSHDKPCFVKPETITSHSGLVGLGSYIKSQKPPLLLHGHLHDRYVERYASTLIRCCYRVESFSVSF